MIPALVADRGRLRPTTARWCLSQVFLSFGIPFALIPLVVFTSSRYLMGPLANRRPTIAAATVVTAVIVGLNIYLMATPSPGVICRV